MNLLSVNKATVNKKPMNLALLAAGTVSAVWFDEGEEITRQAKQNMLSRAVKLRKEELD